MRNNENINNITLDLSFSLLWPKGRQADTVRLCPETGEDLDTDKLIRFISTDNRSRELMQGIVSLLCQDCDTINFRLDIIDDLLRFPVLIDSLNEIMPVISSLRFYVSHVRTEERNALVEVVWRLRELEYYVKCIRILRNGLKNTGVSLQSAGLKKLVDLVDTIENDPVYERLISELPGLLEKINSLKSVTIGVNLNAGLVPFEATLVSINDKPFKDAPVWGSLFGSKDSYGIAPLHSAPADGYTNPLMIPLFKDISDIVQKMTKPLARSLKKFISINSRLIIKLQEDFLFYLGAVHIIKFLRTSGLPMTRPRVLKKEKREVFIKDLYNINLVVHIFGNQGNPSAAFASTIIKNDFYQNDNGRIVILTGPNRGGKTTFLQAAGLAQLLMQVGLFVPAQEAEMSISDNIFTHYPAQEELEKGTGRFGEEAQRLHAIFNSATRFSLILLNESLSSTSIGESLYLAQDIVRVLRMLGSRVVYTTHIHELASMVDAINNDTQGESKLISMVALVEKVEGNATGVKKPSGNSPGETTHYSIKPTFKIVPGPPMGQSYAIELASKFGISREQLVARLKERGEIE